MQARSPQQRGERPSRRAQRQCSSARRSEMPFPKSGPASRQPRAVHATCRRSDGQPRQRRQQPIYGHVPRCPLRRVPPLAVAMTVQEHRSQQGHRKRCLATLAPRIVQHLQTLAGSVWKLSTTGRCPPPWKAMRGTGRRSDTAGSSRNGAVATTAARPRRSLPPWKQVLSRPPPWQHLHWALYRASCRPCSPIPHTCRRACSRAPRPCAQGLDVPVAAPVATPSRSCDSSHSMEQSSPQD
mmetsp:Transcript_71468/g.155229  ORF Transcript_71468/g.155229 Transcript_71468/m.155229 type:complete len:240 (+) Transcript_71468:2066-2785(+)